MISIVVPVLNEEMFLRDCLESLKQQDYTGDFEITVVDNGSTDGSVAIAESLGVKLISSPEKKSVFYARQVGADAVTGDIIIQADGDTIYPRDWLRRLARHFTDEPKVVAVTGRFTYKDPPGWAWVEYWLRGVLNWLTGILAGWPLFISGATFAFRRDAFLKGNGYNGLTYAPDQIGIASRLAGFGKVKYDSEVCVLTSSRRVNDKSFLKVLREGTVNAGRWLGFILGLMTAPKPARKPSAKQIGFKFFPIITIFLAFIVYGYFIPSSAVFGHVYSEAETTSELVALTFDDGPNEPYTSQIINTLAGYDVKATFFLIGRNAELYPEIARHILEQGHVVGNHSYSHKANHAVTEYDSRDLVLGQLALFSVLGVKPHLYRPPHGTKTPWELQNAEDNGLAVVTWSVSTPELSGHTAEQIAEEIVRETRPGAIILLQDGYSTSLDVNLADKSKTVRALPLIIEGLYDRGYTFVTVPQLLNIPAYID